MIVLSFILGVIVGASVLAKMEIDLVKDFGYTLTLANNIVKWIKRVEIELPEERLAILYD